MEVNPDAMEVRVYVCLMIKHIIFKTIVIVAYLTIPGLLIVQEKYIHIKLLLITEQTTGSHNDKVVTRVLLYILINFQLTFVILPVFVSIHQRKRKKKKI